LDGTRRFRAIRGEEQVGPEMESGVKERRRYRRR